MTAKHTEGKLRAAVHEAPWHNGDGYSYGGDVILTVGALAINLGSCAAGIERRELLALAARLALCWNEHGDLVKWLRIARSYVDLTADYECGSEEGVQARQDLEEIDALLARIKEASR